jgi:hypothetical protein
MPASATEPTLKPRSRRDRPFHHRLLLAVGLSVALLAGALGIGVLGFQLVAGIGWLNSLHNAALVLAGLGTVNATDAGAVKVFTAAYALFSNLVFIGVTGILLAPVFHRVLHKFHIEERDLR